MKAKNQKKEAHQNQQSKPENESQNDRVDLQPKRSAYREIAEVLLFGLCLLLFFKTFVWQNFQIPTASMENSLLIGDHITANTFMFKNASGLEKKLFPFRDVRRGDVIVFKFVRNDQEDWIKRCIGLPGDRVDVIEDQVFLNGKPLQEEYTFYKAKDRAGRDPENRYYPVDYHVLEPGISNAQYLTKYSVTMQQIKELTRRNMRPLRLKDPEKYREVMARLESGPENVIPEGFYLMMGDNRNHSYDGRFWGLLPKELVHGRAYFVWWSYGEDENSHQRSISERIFSYARLPITFFTRTHWPETFARIR